MTWTYAYPKLLLGKVKNVGAAGSSITGFTWLILSVVALFFDSTRWFGIFMLGSCALFLVGILVWALVSAKSDERKAGIETERQRSQLEDQAKRRRLLLDSAKQTVDVIVTEHLETLANQRDVLVRADRYGVVDGQAWNKEVQYFVDTVVRPKLSYEEAEAIAASGMSAFFQNAIEERVARHSETRPLPDRVPDAMTPVEFEGACAAVLRSLGWDASTTQGSGDQGADVIATKNGRRLVIQCKLYTGVVGNKSIQEVIAAKVFYHADLAVVVCNSGYTKSAMTLAAASGVKPLTYPELRLWAVGLDAETASKAG